MKLLKRVWLLLSAVIVCLGSAHVTWAEDKLTVYSSRNEQLIKPLFDAYKEVTGTQIRFITDKAGPLMERLKAEGDKTEADLLITVDAGNLWQAAQLGLLQPVLSETLDINIPAHLRDPKNEWYGLSVRARTIFYNKDKVKPESLSTYEDLANPKWKGKLCLRTSKKVYNQSLVAMLIAQHGIEKTEEIVKGWVDNLATDVFPDDTKLLKAIAAGQCEVGIANTYYYGRLLKKQPDFPVGLFWANQNSEGTHVNVSGAGVTKYAKQKERAIKFLNWLSSNQAQHLFADANMEYPANPSVPPAPEVEAWGSFKQNLINVAKAGELQVEAIKLMDRAGYR